MLKMMNKMRLECKKPRRISEAGNVLFLILIAVVLFAALSYAVTQSSRSGGGGADGEANLVNSAQITQYPASVRTAIVRMIIGGVDVTQLNFDPPSAFGATCTGNPTPCVFHPNGGGATYVTAPAAVTANGGQGQWLFTSDFAIEDIGTTANDIIALLPGVGASICQRLNTELGIPHAGDGDGDNIGQGPTTDPVDSALNMDSTSGLGIGTAANGVAAFFMDGDFKGQPFGCYDTEGANDPNVYYHVLVER